MPPTSPDAIRSDTIEHVVERCLGVALVSIPGDIAATGVNAPEMSKAHCQKSRSGDTT
jgi:hypothetical protein